VANWHTTARPIGSDAPAPAPTTPQPPPGLAFGQAAQALTGPGSLDGLGRPVAGLTTPHELARELGTRLQMAVREGGRELVVTLRPAELGHLTIRVTVQDGVLQAQILADRPEAARMLQQSLGHLGSALGDLGYSLENLDVAYGGGDPRDAQASGDADGAVRGEVQEADGTPVAASDDPATAVAGSPARLDLLA
jgi:flagellar hook-length control protein FliK